MKQLKGTVIKSTGSWYRVLTENDQEYDCRIKGKFRLEGMKSTNPIAIGDNVQFHVEEQHEYAVIDKIEERRNFLIRKAPNLSRQTHIIAANIDFTVLIVSQKMPKISSAFIDRFIVISEAYEIKPIIVFNKIDIYSDEDHQKCVELSQLYTSLGYKVFLVSAKTGEHLQSLVEFLHGSTSLFIGQSGVGKSTILNHIKPDLQLKTKEVSKYYKKGVHTTSFYQMHQVAPQTFVIDSPGIKELGLYGFKAYEISLFFPEMKKLAGACKFNTCLHVNEPKCAVKTALENGEIREERYINYLKILEDFEI